MNKLEQAARQALEALEDAYENGFLTGITGLKAIDVLTALREALAEQALQKLSDFHQTMEQEPAGIVWDASAPVVMDSSAPKNENQEVAELRKQVAALKAVVDAWKNVEQAPVAWVDLEQWQSGEYECFTSEKVADYMTPLYASHVRTKDLTDGEIFKTNKTELPDCQDLVDFARAVIKKFKEKINANNNT